MGIWEILLDVGGTLRKVQIDLLVPNSLGGAGRRGARIPPHSKRVARKVVGLEGALVDRDIHLLPSLDPSDGRRIEVAVAGPGALVVAKVHKIAERVDDADRLREKDALDIYRLLRVIDLDDMVRRLNFLRRNTLSRDVTEQAIESLPRLFGSIRTSGTMMVQRAIGPLAGGATPAASLVELVNDLLREL